MLLCMALAALPPLSLKAPAQSTGFSAMLKFQTRSKTVTPSVANWRATTQPFCASIPFASSTMLPRVPSQWLSKAGEQKLAEFEVKDLEDKLTLGDILQSFRDKLTVVQNILVAAAWAREDEVELFKKFPHVFMFDVTFNTNSEKRPLGVSLGIDGNMNSFSPFCVFMPSMCLGLQLDIWSRDTKPAG